MGHQRPRRHLDQRSLNYGVSDPKTSTIMWVFTEVNTHNVPADDTAEITKFGKVWPPA